MAPSPPREAYARLLLCALRLQKRGELSFVCKALLKELVAKRDGAALRAGRLLRGQDDEAALETLVPMCVKQIERVLEVRGGGGARCDADHPERRKCSHRRPTATRRNAAAHRMMLSRSDDGAIGARQTLYANMSLAEAHQLAADEIETAHAATTASSLVYGERSRRARAAARSRDGYPFTVENAHSRHSRPHLRARSTTRPRNGGSLVVVETPTPSDTHAFCSTSI